MEIRILKIVLVVFVGLQGWFYVAGNLANWNSAMTAVSYVVGMHGHEIYSNPIFPAITHSAAITIALVCIVLGEFLIGAFCLKGAWDLWTTRKANGLEYNAAKKYAILGAGMALVVWFGGFIVVGGGLFQMWQTKVGIASFEGAFMYGAVSGLILLFVNSSDA
ncbi:DUF2165 family protein [Aliiglaciecola lipolytica]|uniref:Small integral membrane protein n=1 Tax=Aliiglaciecola lipolytica E3 TaxID=1127673 RepID=K6YDE9_9ALTE|nr:DUF2165 family protein [Aliiglaciecola lipolytica]GAC16222.1 hypothetical protein GLIP_3611 [Aliiglaciecola lipolytica E3]